MNQRIHLVIAIWRSQLLRQEPVHQTRRVCVFQCVYVVLKEDFINAGNLPGRHINGIFQSAPRCARGYHGVNHAPDMVLQRKSAAGLPHVYLLFDVCIFPQLLWRNSAVLYQQRCSQMRIHPLNSVCGCFYVLHRATLYFSSAAFGLSINSSGLTFSARQIAFRSSA